jgi:hypothetical protein
MNVFSGNAGAPSACNRCYDKPSSQASIVRSKRLAIGENSSKGDYSF